jgi:hypothetical protein
MMCKQFVTSICGMGKLFDGDQFIADCTYQLDEYQEVNRRVASQQDAGTVLQVKGRIQSVPAAPDGVPLVLHLNGKHRIRIVTRGKGRVVTFGGFFGQPS